MNETNDFINPDYPELSKLRFKQRMNDYAMHKWLLVANIAVWSAAAYIMITNI